MCSFLGWGQCNGLLHPPCHSQGSVCHSFPIPGPVVLPFLYSMFHFLFMPVLPYQDIYFLCQGSLISLQDPWQVCSPWVIFSVCPPVQVKTSGCGFLPVSFFYHRLSWFVFFSGRVFSENLCLELKNKWSWGKSIVLEGINSWGEDIVLEGINSSHHLVPTSLAQGLEAAGSALLVSGTLYILISCLWFSSDYWNHQEYLFTTWMLLQTLEWLRCLETHLGK